MNAESAKLKLAADSEVFKRGDKIVISTSEGPLSANITGVSGHIANADLTDLEKKLIPDKIWKINGATAAKVPTLKTASVDNADATDIESLRVITRTNRAIQLALKFHAENNATEALKLLGQLPASTSLDIPALQSGAEIYQSIGEMPSLESTLFKILKISANEGHAAATLISEANILKIQAESIQSIPGDKNLSGRLSEIISRLTSVNNELSTAFKTDEPVLEYTRLMSIRKKAECDDDVITIGTMGAAWDSFESALNRRSGTESDRKIWGKLIARERSKATLSTKPGDKQM